MLELEPTRPQADEVVHVSTRRCSSADSRRRHPFVFVPFVVVRLSPFRPASRDRASQGCASRDCRSGGPERLPERIQRTKRTRTAPPRAYPLSIARSPKSWTGPFSFENREY